MDPQAPRFEGKVIFLEHLTKEAGSKIHKVQSNVAESSLSASVLATFWCCDKTLWPRQCMEESILAHDSRRRVHNGSCEGWLHVATTESWEIISSETPSRKDKQNVGESSELSKPKLSGMLPPSRLHCLTKQHHRLEIKCSNTGASERQFIQAIYNVVQKQESHNLWVVGTRFKWGTCPLCATVPSQATAILILS